MEVGTRRQGVRLRQKNDMAEVATIPRAQRSEGRQAHKDLGLGKEILRCGGSRKFGLDSCTI